MGQTMTNKAAALTRISMQRRLIDIEYKLINAEKRDADLIVFLHEGLGSVAMWRDFPELLCAATQTRGLVYSRYGYGGSTPKAADENWPVSYMHEQAIEALPALLAELGLQNERPVLYGHSDGASIALLYAALYPDAVKGIVVAAPHIFVEDITIASIEAARIAYANTDLPSRLGKFHQDADATFRAWNDVWLNPEFRHWNIEPYLPQIRCPVLAIQGEDDEYGTLAQIQGIVRLVSHAQPCILANCRHSPHKDQTNAVVLNVQDFLRQLQ
ncbi:alpha/beta hydrolase [Pusillimonas sp. CC-YST705]|uniref:Alpha/beta hydrolase n=1 Tax=Mesopusillimonas faecipullorum TaxID=2755040 RepID=A0ABS8CEZ1_9BURK|nr:alpha/beta hydrolase [Mesopusillimonas faecipullorum]MCB5364573.1 alpha/beta hydrolase [Mesopusillimonas faecipullorum]